MPKPSNASDCCSPDRKAIADYLYIERGASDASKRCQINSALGSWNLLAEVLKKLCLKQGESIVDVGCGTGQHLVRFSEEVKSQGLALGIDFNPDAIGQVRARGLEGVVASGAKLPLPHDSFDALTCNYAIYYLDEIRAVLAEWHRVLKPGGRMVISGPALQSNRELYQFHREVTGCDPTDADRMALSFVEDVVAKLVPAAGFENMQVDEFHNAVSFPNPTTFLDYWAATSLFARTPGVNRASGEAWFCRSGREDFVVTKCVSVLSAVKTRG